MNFQLAPETEKIAELDEHRDYSILSKDSWDRIGSTVGLKPWEGVGGWRGFCFGAFYLFDLV